jgi:hypothetical protein
MSNQMGDKEEIWYLFMAMTYSIAGLWLFIVAMIHWYHGESDVCIWLLLSVLAGHESDMKTIRVKFSQISVWKDFPK